MSQAESLSDTRELRQDQSLAALAKNALKWPQLAGADQEDLVGLLQHRCQEIFSRTKLSHNTRCGRAQLSFKLNAPFATEAAMRIFKTSALIAISKPRRLVPLSLMVVYDTSPNFPQRYRLDSADASKVVDCAFDTMSRTSCQNLSIRRRARVEESARLER